MLDDQEELGGEDALAARIEATARLQKLGYENPPGKKKPKGSPGGAGSATGPGTLRLLLQLKTVAGTSREITADNVHHSALGAPALARPAPAPTVRSDVRVRAAVDPDDLRSELATVDLSAHQSQGGKLRCYLEHFAETVRSAVRFQDERFSAAPIACFDVGFSLVPKGGRKAFFEALTSVDQFNLLLQGAKRSDGGVVGGLVVRLTLRQAAEAETTSSQEGQTLPTMWLRVPPPSPSVPVPKRKGEPTTQREGSRDTPATAQPQPAPRGTAPHRQPSVPTVVLTPHLTPDVAMPAHLKKDDKALLEMLNARVVLIRARHPKCSLMLKLMQQALDVQEKGVVDAQQVHRCAVAVAESQEP